MQANKGLPCIQFMQCIHFMQHERTKLSPRTTLLSLACLPATWHTRPKFNASSWLLSVPWPPLGPHSQNSMLLIGYSVSHGQVGGVSYGKWGPATGQAVKKKKVHVCMRLCVYMCGKVRLSWSCKPITGLPINGMYDVEQAEKLRFLLCLQSHGKNSN